MSHTAPWITLGILLALTEPHLLNATTTEKTKSIHEKTPTIAHCNFKAIQGRFESMLKKILTKKLSKLTKKAAPLQEKIKSLNKKLQQAKAKKRTPEKKLLKSLLQAQYELEKIAKKKQLVRNTETTQFWATLYSDIRRAAEVVRKTKAYDLIIDSGALASPGIVPDFTNEILKETQKMRIDTAQTK